ncbi:MAG: CBS domain-containing protein [Gammaproteobacteria bacterium]|nr:CBS domain-containing protein [Gammaproteobacteria bacterium]
MIAVAEVMTKSLLTLPDSASVWEARQLMTDRRIRHIPIVNTDNEFVGILTQRDVLATTVSVLAEVEPAEIQALESAIPVREVMTVEITAVDPETDLREAARYMLDHKLGCLPVVSEKGLVGIITEVDYIKLVLRLLERLDV